MEVKGEEITKAWNAKIKFMLKARGGQLTMKSVSQSGIMAVGMCFMRYITSFSQILVFTRLFSTCMRSSTVISCRP